MKFFKSVADGYLIAISVGTGKIPISESEYEYLKKRINSLPNEESNSEFRLNANTLEWEKIDA